jgi:hypothetical protein
MQMPRPRALYKNEATATLLGSATIFVRRKIKNLPDFVSQIVAFADIKQNHLSNKWTQKRHSVIVGRSAHSAQRGVGECVCVH